MRVLLINANRFKQPWPIMPFGLCCVASAAKSAGHEVRVLDLCFPRNPQKEIARTVAEFHPEVVGLSIRNIDNSTGYNTLFLLDNVRRDVVVPLKQVFPGPIVIGGPSVGINGAEMLEYFELEFAIRGDGEAAFVEFLHRSHHGESLTELGGLVWRKKGQIVADNAPLMITDMDSLPPVRPHRWLNVAAYRRYGTPLPVQTKRGCRLNCSYCTYNRIEGKFWRLKSPKRVADEIEEMARETGMRTFEFTDSTFNLPLRHCKAVLRELIARDLKLDLRTLGLNPAGVDEELIALMKEAGFTQVDLGVESGSDETLRGLGKNYGKEAVLKAGMLLRTAKLPTTWFLLLGGPNETPETLAETFATVNEAADPWDLVNIGVGLRVYNGAPLAEELRKNGAKEAKGNFFQPMAWKPEALTTEDVKLLTKREALKRTNYFMYDEDEKIPLAVLWLLTALLRVLSPKRPLWHAFVLLRRAQKAFGVTRLKRFAFAWRHGRILAQLDKPAVKVEPLAEPAKAVRRREETRRKLTSVLSEKADQWR